ncbi:hypothetical protein [Gilliamella sp. wkB108]|uniref:hypothetical protein n=1 Tax=Gilliamella sp. wkB108 TaxID=3120256 RepID=UPI0011477E1B|nr:hypothetical protein [Gilliamella apicola]
MQQIASFIRCIDDNRIRIDNNEEIMMKFLKILALFFMSFILVNCDNSKSDSTNTDSSKTSQSSQNYDASQAVVIAEAKKQLPIKVDQITTLVDIFAKDNFINYKYQITETPKDALLVPESQQIILDNIRQTYCSDLPEIKSLRAFFPNGANYHYYIDDEKIFSLQLTPASCQAK